MSHLSRQRIFLFGHLARLGNDTPVNMAFCLHVNTSLSRPPTARGDAHLAVHETSVSTSLETTLAILLESSGGTLLAADMVVQQCDGPRQLSNHDDDDDAVSRKEIFTYT